MANLPYEEPQVISVTGTGDIPQGHHLWIFVYAPGVGSYYPQDKLDSPSPNPWTVSGVHLGSTSATDNGSTFTIYALLTDDTTDAQITSFAEAYPGEGYSEEQWQTSFAPLVVGSTQVQRF